MSTRPEASLARLDAPDQAAELLGGLRCGSLRPFSKELVAFFGDLSRRLVGERELASRFPDATAFGYWIRPTNLERLRRRFEALSELQAGVRVPRGLSFHVAPGNVEALFAYSWATAALCGNSSIVKVSSRGSDLAGAVIDVVDDTLADHPDLQHRWRFALYPREREDITTTFTRGADLLVFWGGDDTVSHLRRLPSRPDATVVSFPDRESLLVIDTQHYAQLDVDGRDEVARRCAADIFSFGQAACSSPRYVVWVGHGDADRTALAEDLYGRIGVHASRLGDITPTEIMNKRTFLYELAALGGLEQVDWRQPQWLVVRPDLEHVRSVEHPALGTLVEVRADTLDDTTAVLDRADQTVTHVGFSPVELADWIRRSPGPWPKRIRPAGQAVDFDARWDGMDLLAEFTSLTTVD